MSPVVLLHGASGNAATWDPILPAWGWAAPVVLDLPGRGTTNGPALEAVDDLATWLVAELDHRGIARPLLVGHSLGGAIALQAALDHPGAIGAIALVASSSRLKVAPAILRAVRAATSQDPFSLDGAFGPGTTPGIIARYGALAAKTPPESARADWAACDAFDVRHRLGSLRTPTLVIHGSNDALTPPRFQKKLAEATVHATRVEIPGAGHMLPWEAPSALAEAVERWRR